MTVMTEDVTRILERLRSETEAASRTEAADMIEALHQQLADAQAAQALVVWERAVEHVAAIERLAASASIASCTCQVKTPDIEFHFADCRYVKLQYILAQCEGLRDLADPTGVEALAALRAEIKHKDGVIARLLTEARHQDHARNNEQAMAIDADYRAETAEAERDALAAKLAAAEARVGALTEAAQQQEQNYLFLHSAAYDVWKWFEVARPDLIGPRAEKLRDAVMGPRPYGCAALTTPAEETKG